MPQMSTRPNKEKLIAQLNEQKIAITHTVLITKGLDPNAQMEPSGVEEIGKIRQGLVPNQIKVMPRKLIIVDQWGEEQGMLDIDAPVSTTAQVLRVMAIGL